MTTRLQDVIKRGTRAAQPAANAVPAGTLYCVTDESNLVERSTGSAWETFASAAGVTDHGALTGLTDDDHSQYLLASAATDRATFAANWADLTDSGETTLHTHAGVTEQKTPPFVEGFQATQLWEYPGIGDGHIFVTIDNGSTAITTGVKGDLYVPFSIKLHSVTIIADQTGSSIVIDIWNDTLANHPPTDADSITASDPPTLNNAATSQDNTLTGWTTDINGGTTLRFNVDSITTCTRVQLILGYTRRDIP